MKRLLLLALGLGLPFAADAQDATLKARCDQLYALADRAMSRRGKGGSGPNLTVQGASVDCAKGRYAQGIATFEKVLRSQGYTVPPA